MANNGFIPPHGNYKKLKSYQKSLIVYDCTVIFCRRFFTKYDRTVDQMVQAARSGKQNIIEGCMASGTSRGTEIRLLGVARASLEELLEDYHDFLRSKNCELWSNESEQVGYIRKQARGDHESFDTYREFIETRDGSTCANILICLVHQANYLLDQQIRRLEKDFINNGGLRERMYKARSVNRRNDL